MHACQTEVIKHWSQQLNISLKRTFIFTRHYQQANYWISISTHTPFRFGSAGFLWGDPHSPRRRLATAVAGRVAGESGTTSTRALVWDAALSQDMLPQLVRIISSVSSCRMLFNLPYNVWDDYIRRIKVWHQNEASLNTLSDRIKRMGTSNGGRINGVFR